MKVSRLIVLEIKKPPAKVPIAAPASLQVLFTATALILSISFIEAPPGAIALLMLLNVKMMTRPILLHPECRKIRPSIINSMETLKTLVNPTLSANAPITGDNKREQILLYARKPATRDVIARIESDSFSLARNTPNIIIKIPSINKKEQNVSRLNRDGNENFLELFFIAGR